MLTSKHHVSAKIALFDEAGEHVLLMFYPGRRLFGLPGGHVDKGEEPDTTIVRELEEELGLKLSIADIQRKDFFLNKITRGKVILAYLGRIPRDTVFNEPHRSFEYGQWVTKQELDAIDTLATGYRQFILENWPTAQP